MKKAIRKAIVAVFIVAILPLAFALTACGEKPELKSIAIQYPADKVDYVVGETFDTAGMVVIGIYSDDSTEVIKDYTVDITRLLTEADTTITVSYGGFNVTQEITCIPASEKVVLEFNAIGSRILLYCYADLSMEVIMGGYNMVLETGVWSYKNETLTLSFDEDKMGPKEVVPTLNVQDGYEFGRNTMLGDKIFACGADIWQPALDGKTYG